MEAELALRDCFAIWRKNRQANSLWVCILALFTDITVTEEGL